MRCRGRLSHYGESWREHVTMLAPDAVATDTRTIPESEIVRFTVSGPLADRALPQGIIAHAFDTSEPWVDRPSGDIDPRLGNAAGFDVVALDVYLTVLRRFDRRVFDPHHA